MAPEVSFFVCTVGEAPNEHGTVFVQFLGADSKLSSEILCTPDEADAIATELITAAASARNNEAYGTGDKRKAGR